MKKLFFLAFAAVLLLGLGLVLSCGGDDDDDDSSDDAATDDDTSGDDDDDTSADDDTSVDDDDSSGDDDDDTSADDDTSGNLTWQEPPSSDTMTWEDARAYCDNLSFDGHDDWRLPTISELRSLIRGCDATVTGGACNATDDCLDLSCWNDPCHGCDSLAGPGSGGAYWPDGMSGEISWYWSSSPVADLDAYAWFVHFNFGGVDIASVDNNSSARCVRP